MSGEPDERDPSARFLRGLTLGAFLGAIVAGSAWWTRVKGRRRGAPVSAAANTVVKTEAADPEARPDLTPPPG